MTAVACEQVQDAAPELALGLLTGRERATHLAHLEHCGACRAEVSALAVAADDVLLAAPQAAPPDGFEHRVLDRLAALPERGPGGPTPGRPRRWRRAAALAVAAAVTAATGIGIGGDRSSGPDTVAADVRTGRGQLVGTATVTVDRSLGGSSDDGPITVSVRLPGWPRLVERYGAPGGDHWLAVELDDGSRSLDHMPPEATSWNVPLRAAAEDVAAVSVLDGDGRAWCTARFPA